MNTNARIKTSMRQQEEEVLHYIRTMVTRRGTKVCWRGECWPPSYLWKAMRRLEEAGVIVQQAHFGRMDTARNRARGIHFRVKRGGKPVTVIP